MTQSFWLVFWFVEHCLFLLFDAAWWFLALRLTKNRLWRILVSVFMAGQMAALFSLFVGLDWSRHAPQSLLLLVIVWHYFGFIAILPLLIARFGPRIARKFRWRPINQPSPPAAVPACVNTLTRREFIGAYAALAPPLLSLGLTGVGLAQTNSFRVRRFTLSISTLPPALDGMTIAHVTDMHVGPWTRGSVLRRMVDTTNGLRADLVLLTGDLIHYHLADLPEAISLVNAMQGRYGLWLIEGNHDVAENRLEFERRMKASSVPFLMNESAITKVRGYPVQLFGMNWLDCNDRKRDRETPAQLRELLKQRQPDAFPILLAHHPHAFDAAVQADLPLTLAGHTHGGQWMLDATHGVGSLFFRYWSGLYTRARSQMIVSNGVGNVFPIRINAPAEIVHLTLRCA